MRHRIWCHHHKTLVSPSVAYIGEFYWTDVVLPGWFDNRSTVVNPGHQPEFKLDEAAWGQR